METSAVPILQSPAWAAVQRALGRTVYERSGDGWQYLAVVERGRLGSRLYTPLGPAVSSLGALADAVADLRALAADAGVDFVRIEPTAPVTAGDMPGLGARLASRTVQPDCTVLNDVTLSEDDIVAAFGSSARRNWRNGLKKGLEVEHTTDPAAIEILLSHLNEVAARTGMKPHSDDYLRTVSRVLLEEGAAGFIIVRHEGEPVGSLLYYQGNEQMMFAHSASLTSARALNPTYTLASEALLLAHRLGDKWFDFCGAAPEGAPETHPWFGFTDFKLRFGGERVERAGTWEIPVRGLRYRAYRLALRVAG
ncbi:MAG: peptidoglycan bridge formation glycyltransferase FemA/FemB family protein [Demequina sp.]|nr:peptidoglycan bridge formation glycyltransferase FemA/FemB family protein [Demequina sp.]